MLYIIHKINFDDRELLPDIVDTPLWEKYDSLDCTPMHRRISVLYQLICQRDNYFQTNTPTPFGNPEYSLYQGQVVGFLQAMDWGEKTVNDQIVIYKDNKKETPILIVDKLKRPDSYFRSMIDNRELTSIFK